MKKLLKHALLICAGLSAGALYAPYETLPTKDELIKMVNEYRESLSNGGGSAFPTDRVRGALAAGSNLCKQFGRPPTLKNLYNAILVTKHQHTDRNPIGYDAASYVIMNRANKEGIIINLNQKTDFTQENVDNINWWKCNYIGIANSYPHFKNPNQGCTVKHVLKELLPTTLRANLLKPKACALFRSKNTETFLKWCFDKAKGNTQDLSSGPIDVALKNSKKRPVPSLALPALALNPTVARAPIPGVNCSYPSSSAAAPTGRSRTLGMEANPQGQKEDDPHTPKPTPFPPPLEPTRPLLEPTQPLLESELVKSELPELLASEWDHILGRWKNTLAPCIDAEDKAKLFPAPPAKRQRTGGG